MFWESYKDPCVIFTGLVNSAEVTGLPHTKAAARRLAGDKESKSHETDILFRCPCSTGHHVYSQSAVEEI